MHSSWYIKHCILCSLHIKYTQVIVVGKHSIVYTPDYTVQVIFCTVFENKIYVIHKNVNEICRYTVDELFKLVKIIFHRALT